MFAAVPSPALGLSFDPSHLVWLQIPHIPDVIRAYGSKIYHVDGKDTEILPARLARQGILGSGWWRYRLPGLGALDWSAIFSALADIGYDGDHRDRERGSALPRRRGDPLGSRLSPGAPATQPTRNNQGTGKRCRVIRFA